MLQLGPASLHSISDLLFIWRSPLHPEVAVLNFLRCTPKVQIFVMNNVNSKFLFFCPLHLSLNAAVLLAQGTCLFSASSPKKKCSKSHNSRKKQHLQIVILHDARVTGPKSWFPSGKFENIALLNPGADLPCLSASLWNIICASKAFVCRRKDAGPKNLHFCSRMQMSVKLVPSRNMFTLPKPNCTSNQI